MEIDARIRELIESHEVVLFMKGDRRAPSCGFSAKVVDILDDHLDDYHTVNVLTDPTIREGIKAFSSWPTIPQLYVKQSFVGGSDIVSEMKESGELGELLGAVEKAISLPEVELTESAAAAFLRYHEGEGPCVVRLTIGRDFTPLLDLDDPEPKDVVLELGKITLVMDRSTSRRADGVRIDFIEKDGTAGFKVENPNAPPEVKRLSVKELHAMRETGKPHLLLDVRPEGERRLARIEGDMALEEIEATIADLDRDKPLVFYCHHGHRSMHAAQRYLAHGFREVYNLEGGVEAWSRQVDPKVPRY